LRSICSQQHCVKILVNKRESEFPSRQGPILKLTKFIKILFASSVLTWMVTASAGQSEQRWTPEGVLAMMDKSAQDFHSLSADIEHVKYTAVVQDSSSETGQIWVRRDEKMRIEMSKPDPKTILREGESLFIYTPKINQVEEFNLGKNRAMVDQYLRLGFGTRSESLKKSFLVALANEEELDQRKTVVIELTPKSDEIRRQISKIQMWIDESSWLPIQQKFYEAGSGDYLVFHYRNLMKNLKVSDSKFKQDWPKGVNRIKPRG
jgi:outer membrane lipoprotein-sorting protein